jgi:NitT/TauT family transport system ATP-binding protein
VILRSNQLSFARSSGTAPIKHLSRMEPSLMDTPSKNDARIVVRSLGVTLGSRRVLDDVNVTIGKREVVAIVGPSGCGKTTLLRCIDGLVHPTDGEVTINGELVTSPPAGVAMVFQGFGLFPWKTMRENIGYGLKVASVPKAEAAERVNRFIDLVGLAGFEEAYPHQLSGGMQQRAGIARALAVEPDVLLMDEPFGSVDAQTREILQFELLRIWERTPTSMVFVTHSIEEAVLMGDRVVVLKGRPSRVEEVIDVNIPRPRTREVLGTPRFSEVREHVWSILRDEAEHAERLLLDE